MVYPEWYTQNSIVEDRVVKDSSVEKQVFDTRFYPSDFLIVELFTSTDFPVIKYSTDVFNTVAVFLLTNQF